MGAIAVSKKEEEQIERLRKDLGIASKSALIRIALKTLEKKSQEEKITARYPGLCQSLRRGRS